MLRRAAGAGFEAFVTMDRNLEYQQNIGRQPFGVVLIHARDNRVETIVPLAPAVVAALADLRPGTIARVGA